MIALLLNGFIHVHSYTRREIKYEYSMFFGFQCLFVCALGRMGSEKLKNIHA